MTAAYCKAILCYDQRIVLDGAPAEAVNPEARDLAAKQLAERKTPEKQAKTAAPAGVNPKPAPALTTETPEQLRARVRSSLLRRSA